jgi:glutathione S-transferase
MRKIYGIKDSTAFRTLWMAEELGIEYEQVPLDFSKGEHKTPEYLKINPNAVVPSLVEDDGFAIWESMAISFYLCDRYKPELLGKDSMERGQAIQWSMWMSEAIDDHLRTALTEKFYGQKRQEVIDMHFARLDRAFPILEAHLDGKQFMLGDTFSVADVNAGALLDWAPPIDYDLGKFPNVKRFFDAMVARPAYQKAKSLK